MRKNKQTPKHVVHTRKVAREAVNSVVNTIDDAYFSKKKLEKSRKLQSRYGRRHENLKLATKYIHTAEREAKRESIRAYSKERTAAVLARSVEHMHSAKILTNATIAKVGVLGGLILRPFRNAGASLSAGFRHGLNPAGFTVEETTEAQA